MAKEYTITKEEGIKRICEAIREAYAISDAIDDEHLATNSTFSSVKIDSLLSDIDTRVDKLESGSGSGSGGNIVSANSSYTIENSVNYPLMSLNMYGKSIQQQYSGKNLFDFNAWKDSISSVTNGTAVYGKNSIKLTATDNHCDVLGENYITVKPSTTYTLSWNADSNKYGGIDITMDGFPITGEGGDNSETKKITFTTNSDTTSIRVQFGVQNAGESITYSNIQLEVGETATSYEPYVGGVPAPNPNYPQEIKSVGDNGFDIISKNDTHFNLLSVRDNGGDIITKQPVSTVVKVGKQATFTVAATGEGLTYKWQLSSDGATWYNPGATTAAYSFVAKAANNGWMYRCVVTDSNGKSVISDEATLYVLADDCEITTASIETVLPLCGIPVSEGGNYTDSNGQQWIADELIYNADGTGKIIKRTAKIDSYNGETITTPFISTTGSLTTGTTVIYAIDTPQEIELTVAEVDALRTLQTFDGVTSISNSAGAEMSVKFCTNKALSEYVLPIFNGLQMQIDELRAAVLSLGGNV